MYTHIYIYTAITMNIWKSEYVYICIYIYVCVCVLAWTSSLVRSTVDGTDLCSTTSSTDVPGIDGSLPCMRLAEPERD